MIYVIVLSQFQLQTTASRWQHIFFLLKNTWWSQPLLHHQSSFHGLFVCSYFKSQGEETDVQGVQLFCCSGLKNCGDEWNIFWWRDKQTRKGCKTESDLHSFRIILSVMVSNSVYMSSLLWYKQSYFVLATQTFVGSDVITEKKKTWSAPTSCKSKDRLVCKFHQRLLVVDTKCPRAACILGTDLPLWAKRRKILKQLLLKGRMKTDI